MLIAVPSVPAGPVAYAFAEPDDIVLLDCVLDRYHFKPRLVGQELADLRRPGHSSIVPARGRGIVRTARASRILGSAARRCSYERLSGQPLGCVARNSGGAPSSAS